MTMHRYEIIIWWSIEDDCFIAEVPELRGCSAHGETYDEAIKEIQVAMGLWIDTAKEVGIDVPEPRGRLMFA